MAKDDESVLEPWRVAGKHLESRALADQVAPAAKGRRFSRLGPEESGLEFHNRLDRATIKNYLLSGAGLAVGDVDGNGLPDLLLVSQDGANKLFKQIAPWRFVDAGARSGIVDTKSWGAGAAFADINNGGHLDLYVCNKGAHDEIYLNGGDGTFKGGSAGAGSAGMRVMETASSGCCLGRMAARRECFAAMQIPKNNPINLR